jgi:hypothetical protein
MKESWTSTSIELREAKGRLTLVWRCTSGGSLSQMGQTDWPLHIQSESTPSSTPFCQQQH